MKTDQVIVVGQVWRSSQNGMVYDPRGVSPTICVGHHAGVEPKIIEDMSRRSENIAFKMMPNGNIRAYQADTPDKSGVSELQFTDPRNESPTVIIGNTIKVIENMEHQENKTGITLPAELEGKRFRIRKLTPRECFRLMGVDDSDIDKMQQAGISNSGQYKLAGNSIVVDVLYHIFRRMFIDTEEPDFDGNPTQLTLF